jgi:hypothetical protein
MYRFVGAALLLLLARPAFAGQKGEPATPAQQYRALLKEFQEAQQAWIKSIRAAKTKEEQQKAIANRPNPAKFAARFLEFAQKNAKDPAAVDALVWVTSNTFGGPDSPHGKATAILMTDHVQSDKIGQLCYVMGFRPSPAGEKFLRAVLEKNPHKNVQGVACLALAMQLKNRARGDKAVLKEAEDLFERAADKYADVKVPFGGTVGNKAKGQLAEQRGLYAIGKTAPDIEGTDQDGVKFKLSDYRGKVVLIDFWGHW